MIDLKIFLTVLFQYCREQAMPCCFAHSYDETLFITDHADIDIILARNNIPAIIKMIKAWPELQMVGIVEHPHNTQLYIHGVKQSKSTFICLDIQHNLAFKGIAYLSLNEIFLRQERTSFGIGTQPDPIDLALIYLFTHVLKHRHVTAKARTSILHMVKHNREDFYEILRVYFGNNAEEYLNTIIDTGHIGSINKMRSIFLSRFYSIKGINVYFDMLTEKVKILKQRLFERNDVRIVVMGTDGAGKTTLIKSLIPQLHNIRPAIIHAHLLPVLPTQKEPDSSKVNAQPHAKPNRNLFTSNFKLLYYFMIYWLDALLPYRGSRAIIYDRYITDILVDPKRFRFGGSVKLAHFVIDLLPRIDFYIWVSTPPSIAYGRKPEVPLAVMNGQYEFYKDFHEKHRNSIAYTVSTDPDAVVNRLCTVLEDYYK